MAVSTSIVTEGQLTSWYPGEPEADLTVAVAAAEDYIRSRCRWPAVLSDGTRATPPAALVEAVRILTGRYLARRNTPTGVVGMDDMGAVRLPGSDADVEALIGPWKPVIFG